MTETTLIDAGQPDRSAAILRQEFAIKSANRKRIPGSFQLLLALYVVFTGALPTIVQAGAFGVDGGAYTEFAVAMLAETARDLLLLVPVVILANHPLGILHPLIVAVILWPLLIASPNVVQDYGGWAGIFAGIPVDAPYFNGLPSRSASVVWLGIGKYSGVQILALASTYLGFWLSRGKRNLTRLGTALRNTTSMRSILIGLIGVSLIVLIWFLRFRGGVNEHLTSLGFGRFRELSNYGAIMIVIDVGVTALLVWIAARPGDLKSPLFLMSLIAVMAAEFTSNGSRGNALEVPMMVGLVWAIRRQRIPWKTAMLLVPIMFVAIGLLGAMRTSSWYRSNASEALAKTSWSDSFALAEKEIADRRAISANVPILERGFEVSGGPLLGKSYAAVVAAAVPRPLWPDKPRGGGSLYAQLFLGALVSGTTIPVSPEAEMYWNFGLPGVFVLSLLYGLILRRAYEVFWRRYPGPFATVFYVLVMTTFRFSSTSLVTFEQQMFLLFLCYVIVVMFIPRAERSIAAWTPAGNDRSGTSQAPKWAISGGGAPLPEQT